MKEHIIIEVKNLTKRFEKQEVLRNVNLICDSGTITGITGRNGSGKTVLLKCICGFLQPQEGEILICGKKNIDFLKDEHKLGVIIEEPAFLGHYSGLKNLEFLYDILNKPDRNYLKSVMERVGLQADSRKAVKKYSMGMKQRLAIAQAIMENQEILLLDEPMSGLDIKGMEEIRTLLLNLKGEGKTILMATHNKDDVEKLCDYVYEMKEGKLQRCED